MVRAHDEKATTQGVLRRYGDQSLRTRLYLGIRRLVLPFDALEQRLPRGGKVVDLCCGYGALAMFVALRDPTRDVVGMDWDRRNIAVATTAASGITNVRFVEADLANFTFSGAHAVLLIDSLHYFTADHQLEILRTVRKGMQSGGTLVCRDAIREPHLRFWWNWCHERLMTGFSFTRVRDQSLHFQTLPEFVARLRTAGFEVERVERLRPWLPYADRVFVARAAAAS